MSMENTVKNTHFETKKMIFNVTNIMVVVALLVLFILFAQSGWEIIKTYFAEKEWYYSSFLGENLDITYKSSYIFFDVFPNVIKGFGITSYIFIILSLLLSLVQHILETKNIVTNSALQIKHLNLLSCILNISSYIFLGVFVILTMGPMLAMFLGTFLKAFISPLLFAKITLVLTTIGVSVVCIFLSFRRALRIIDHKSENAIASILLSWSTVLISNVTIAAIIYIVALLLLLALILFIAYVFIKFVLSFFFGYY